MEIQAKCNKAESADAEMAMCLQPIQTQLNFEDLSVLNRTNQEIKTTVLSKLLKSYAYFLIQLMTNCLSMLFPPLNWGC